MSTLRFQALGPLQAGQGSRAVLGLAISADQRAEPVVLIWVPEEAATDAALLARIRKEVDHAASLDHPHIVKVVGFTQLEGRWARVVEFADGEPLRKVLDRVTVLPSRIALRIVCDACTGAHYAHMAGNDDGSPLVHGDLRPETLMISFGGVTKVTGYGALAFAPREMGGQKVGGRRAYSAPEQIIGGREAFTVPTDVYLLGLTLYECLTGMVPWATQAEFFDQAVLTLPLPPAPVGSISPELEKVLMKACSKKAAERYATPFALREALENASGMEVATTEELVAFLSTVFPESESLRADRKKLVDAGIADFVRKQWQAEGKPRPALTPAPMPAVVVMPPPAAPAAPVAPPPAPVPVAIAKPPEPVVPPPPAPVPPPHAPAPTPEPAMTWPPRELTVAAAPPPPRPLAPPDEAPPPNALIKPIGWGLGVVGVIAMVFWLSQTGGPSPSAARFAAQRPDAATVVNTAVPPEALAGLDAGPDAGAPAGPDGGVPPPDGGASAASAIDAGAPAAAPALMDASLSCAPDADLALDGAPVGKTPWRGLLSPGKHTARFENKDLGLLATRTFTVGTDAPTAAAFAFEKGFVAVNAPEGSVVLIDGVKKGLAPISGEIPVYEGSHRIDVKVGQSTWGQAFQLDPAQRVRFNVSFE